MMQAYLRKTGRAWKLSDMGDYLKRNKALLMKSFRIDKRFFSVLAIDLAIVVLLAVGLLLWNRSISTISNDIMGLESQLSSVDVASLYGTQLRDNAAVSILGTFVSATLVLSIYAIAVWTLLKNLLYNRMAGISFSKSVYWRFLVLSLVWGIVSSLLFMFFQYFVYMFLGESFDVSTASRFAVFMLLSAFIILFYWFSINIFTHLVRSGRIFRSLKLAFTTGIMGFGRFLLPLVVSLVGVFIVNAVMYLFVLAGNLWVFLVLSTLLIFFYLTWLRFYFVQLITPVHAPPAVHAHHPKKGNPKKR